jgi:hypothetical protein
VCSLKVPDANFEAFMAVMIQFEVFGAVTPCSVVVGDGGSMDF